MEPHQLSGIVSCDSAAMRIQIRIVRCEWPAKRQSRATEQGGGGCSNGGVSRSGLVLPFLSFADFSGIFLICPGMVRGFSQDFPDLSFPLSQPISCVSACDGF